VVFLSLIIHFIHKNVRKNIENYHQVMRKQTVKLYRRFRGNDYNKANSRIKFQYKTKISGQQIKNTGDITHD